jgi:anti-sigma regulatory factor (Ser/Thr protein kinase)
VTERRTTVPGDAAHLGVLTAFLQEFWSASQLAPAPRTAFELALEEVFTNIIRHGRRPGTVPSVEVSLARVGERITMTVEDDGPQFDPLSRPAPDVTASLAERPIGGLGILLVRQMMDAVSYERIGVRNRLSMTKYLAR